MTKNAPMEQLRHNGGRMVFNVGFNLPSHIGPSHLQEFLSEAMTASVAEINLRPKYTTNIHAYVPIAIETLSAWGDESMQL